MNCSHKLPTSSTDGVGEPLASSDVLNVVQVGKGDLSDWVELMEVVEALCPVWLERERQAVRQGGFKL